MHIQWKHKLSDRKGCVEQPMDKIDAKGHVFGNPHKLSSNWWDSSDSVSLS